MGETPMPREKHSADAVGDPVELGAGMVTKVCRAVAEDGGEFAGGEDVVEDLVHRSVLEVAEVERVRLSRLVVEPVAGGSAEPVDRDQHVSAGAELAVKRIEKIAVASDGDVLEKVHRDRAVVHTRRLVDVERVDRKDLAATAR